MRKLLLSEILISQLIFYARLDDLAYTVHSTLYASHIFLKNNVMNERGVLYELVSLSLAVHVVQLLIFLIFRERFRGLGVKFEESHDPFHPFSRSHKIPPLTSFS